MNKKTLVSQEAMNIPIAELKEALAKAIEADIQQFFTDSLTPDRGYDCPPTSNTMEALQPIFAAAERAESLEKALNDIRLECSREDGEFQTVDVIALKALNQSEG